MLIDIMYDLKWACFDSVIFRVYFNFSESSWKVLQFAKVYEACHIRGLKLIVFFQCFS